MHFFRIYRKKLVGGTFLHPPIMNRIHLLMNKEINLVSIFSDLFWDHRKDTSWSVVRSQIPYHFFKKRWKCFLLLKHLDKFLYQALMSRVKDFLYTSVVSHCSGRYLIKLNKLSIVTLIAVKKQKTELPFPRYIPRCNNSKITIRFC